MSKKTLFIVILMTLANSPFVWAYSECSLANGIVKQIGEQIAALNTRMNSRNNEIRASQESIRKLEREILGANEDITLYKNLTAHLNTTDALIITLQELGALVESLDSVHAEIKNSLELSLAQNQDLSFTERFEKSLETLVQRNADPRFIGIYDWFRKENQKSREQIKELNALLGKIWVYNLDFRTLINQTTSSLQKSKDSQLEVKIKIDQANEKITENQRKIDHYKRIIFYYSDENSRNQVNLNRERSSLVKAEKDAGSCMTAGWGRPT